MDSLIRVRRAAARRRASDTHWREAIRQAIRDGHSQRTVANAAGITHTRVQQILRDE